MSMLTDFELELLENKYLTKFYHFLKFAEDEMLLGFQTKEAIKSQWHQSWSKNGSGDFSVGAERIVYALFNGKGIGRPNSCPVGSDMMFEVDDAYIHIDLKTVQTRNIGDYGNHIFVGENQNSYNYYMNVRGEKREYTPNLPHYYNIGNFHKPCLTYFVTILYEDINLEILNINLICMPNGQLCNIYQESVLKAGKNKQGEHSKKQEARFNFSQSHNFKLLENKYRVKIVYMNAKKILESEKMQKDLAFLLDLYEKQGK
jgi:hypothetical protein